MAVDKMSRPQPAPAPGAQEQALFRAVRARVVQQAAGTDGSAPEGRRHLQELVWQFLEEEESRLPGGAVAPAVRAAVASRVLQGLFGLGLLEPLLQDPAVTEIMINGPESVFVERDRVIQPALDQGGRPLRFDGASDLMHLVQRIVAPLNRKVDQLDPIVDARLPDGSRVNIVLPPVALDGALVTIRKFPDLPFDLDSLVAAGTLTHGLAGLLRHFIRARCNLVISGGTGSGKTTLLNALGTAIDPLDRVVTLEDAAELRLVHLRNLARLETRPPNLEGRGTITMRDLVRTALRMRPDRLIVGEVRGGEALDMLQAMNTGHSGCLTTAHANSAADLLSRLETMVLMAGLDLPLAAVRRQIAGAVDFIIHLARTDHGRQVMQVAEVVSGPGSEAACRELLVREPDGTLRATGHPIGRVEPFRRTRQPVPDPAEALARR